MLYNYKQFINESRQDIDSICQKYNIKNYIINEDGSIDVDGDVDLSNRKLIELPLKFRNVNGNFYCSGNKLTSLEGAPSSVGGDFNCSSNELTSLEGGPSSVGGDFICHNNQLITLEGFPTLFRATMVIDISDSPVKEVYDLFSDLKAIEYINETGCINKDTMEVYYIALLDVWEYSGMEIVKPENIKLRHYTLVY